MLCALSNEHTEAHTGTENRALPKQLNFQTKEAVAQHLECFDDFIHACAGAVLRDHHLHVERLSLVPRRVIFLDRLQRSIEVVGSA